MTSKMLHCALILTTSFGALALDEHTAQGLSLTTAEAVIGRPLTPMSYAGVARRTTRRATYATGAAYAGAATAAYAAGAATAYAASPQTCVQTVDAYGQVVTRC